MTRRIGRLAAAAAAVTATVLSALACGAGTASAAHLGEITFYTNADLTGAEMPIDPDALGVCRNLPEPALSGLDYAVNYVEVYFKPDCVPGAPGTSGDLHYVLGSLHGDDFPYPALSYRVVEPR